MPLIAVVGDCTTTTTLALAAGMQTGDLVVVEADRTGGSIAAWFDSPVSPSLSTVVASLRGVADDTDSAWTTVDGLIRRARSGVRFLPAPALSVEAARAVEEAEVVAFPTIARHATALVDVGRRAAVDGVPAAIRLAETVIVCHRQATASAMASAVRLERTAELVAALAPGSRRTIVAVIGDQPFDSTEICDYLAAAASPETIETHQLAEDDLAAAVLAGRHGVSGRRFARLPLIRSCEGLAALMAGGPADEVARS